MALKSDTLNGQELQCKPGHLTTQFTVSHYGVTMTEKTCTVCRSFHYNAVHTIKRYG